MKPAKVSCSLWHRSGKKVERCSHTSKLFRLSSLELASSISCIALKKRFLFALKLRHEDPWKEKMTSYNVKQHLQSLSPPPPLFLYAKSVCAMWYEGVVRVGFLHFRRLQLCKKWCWCAWAGGAVCPLVLFMIFESHPLLPLPPWQARDRRCCSRGRSWMTTSGTPWRWCDGARTCSCLLIMWQWKVSCNLGHPGCNQLEGCTAKMCKSLSFYFFLYRTYCVHLHRPDDRCPHQAGVPQHRDGHHDWAPLHFGGALQFHRPSPGPELQRGALSRPLQKRRHLLLRT